MSLRKKLDVRILRPLVDADKSLLFGINEIYFPVSNGNINHRVSLLAIDHISDVTAFVFELLG